ncbi:MAG: trypsin-like serine protease [Solirubrobacterales bacterium]|nr:trypsin-like serine protease [Solirubrobacterales bacterium]
MAGMRFTLIAVLAVAGSLAVSSSAGAAAVNRVSGNESSAAARFWTPERAERALRRDPVLGVRSTSTSVSQTRHRPVTVNRPEVGKILGWDRLGGYSCTGTVIDTRSLRLVLTAAHCVYANGMWSRRMVFIPAFKNGRRPYGTYKIKAMWVSNAWQRLSFGSYGTNFDVAILVTRKLWNGSRIGENVGAIEVESNPNRRGVTDIYGYPGAAMGGRVMRTCRSRTKPDWYGGRFFPGPTGMLARCNMAAGSSGGPWVSRYSRPGGGTVGVVDGLTSTGFPQAGRSYLTSPYFGRLPGLLIRATEGR